MTGKTQPATPLASTTSSRWSTEAISAGLLLIRSALFLTGLPQWVQSDHQLSSPLTNYTRLKEGVWLLNHNLNPYAGRLVRHSPLTLAIFSTIIPLNPTASALFWSSCDAVSVICLIRIWRMRKQVSDARQELLIAVTFLLHPYTALPTFALSTSTIDNTLHLLSLYFTMAGKHQLGLFVLAFLTCSSLPSILLAPALILLALRGPTTSLSRKSVPPINWRQAGVYGGQFIAYLGLLIAASSVVAGGFSWVRSTWGAVLLLPDLTPNPGLWWYFFTEMFDHFRPFFLMVFTAHLVIYVAPITFKLEYDPFFAIWILQGIIAMLKSYPTLSDPGLFTAMYTLFPELVPHLSHPLPTVMLHIHSALLLPMFHHLWMGEGTGNANFFYASTLVFGLANAAAIVDGLRAGLKLGFGEREGYELVQS
ncbi:cell division cycle protein 91 [Clavulina sp. PMI_390]|nr:cell division cycle protein 91 [Clavulina sp. PMI_390]